MSNLSTRTVTRRASAAKERKSVKIIPFGGLDQIGMNMTVIETAEDIIVIDCGQAFPDDDMPGIDSIIPDFQYLRDNYSKIRAVVLTHGHEDHIGALPYFLREFHVPVYGTRLTLGLVRSKLEEFTVKNASLHLVQPGDSVDLGEIKVEFIRTNHSIGYDGHDNGNIVIHGGVIDLMRFAELGRKKVLALLSDSTNAERPGYTMSERSVGHVFTEMFPQTAGRILVATFASNVDRVQQIINSADKYGRKVCVEGRSMVNTIDTASKLGYLHIPDNTLIDI